MNSLFTRSFRRWLRFVAISGFGLGLGFSVVTFHPQQRVQANPETVASQPVFTPIVLVQQDTGTRIWLRPRTDKRLTARSRPQWLALQPSGQPLIWMGNRASEITQVELGDRFSLLADNNGVYEFRVARLETLSGTTSLERYQSQADLVVVLPAGGKMVVLTLNQ